MTGVNQQHNDTVPANIYQLTMLWFSMVLFWTTAGAAAAQSSPQAHLSTFGAGSGPAYSEGIYRLLDGSNTPGQSNAIAFDLVRAGAYEQMALHGKLRVPKGGDGGAFVFLNTTEYGRRGPAPFVKSWVEPNLTKTFAVGIDVHNPPTNDPFDAWGNYQGLPEREVSLHWDGLEIVKRLAPVEFRGDIKNFAISVNHVIGGAEITVELAGQKVYDRYFVAGMLPYESRLAIGAGLHHGAMTGFDVLEVEFTKSEPARPRRFPKQFDIFNHVKIYRSAPSHWREVTLPPLGWAFGRVILTLEIHDAGLDWDGWDRNGYLYIVDSQGEKHDIAPFITSFRTPGRWQVDITHFRPWLAGNVKFEIATESGFTSNKGYMMSVSLDFYHGTPPLEPYRVVQLWHGRAKYGSAAIHFSDFFRPQAIEIDTSTRAARLFITTTGHSKVGEFTPSRRTVVFTPEKDGDPGREQMFENVLWKTDNYLNPIRPQYGTWKYARAGWAPGDIIRPWSIDLSHYIIPGKTAELRYLPEPYDFSNLPEDQRPAADQVNQAIQLVRAYLILYRVPADLMEAPPLQVLEVEDGSNASQAGVRAADYLESYDGQRLVSIEDLRNAIKSAKEAGKGRIRAVIHRGPERLDVELRPGRMGVLLEEQ